MSGSVTEMVLWNMVRRGMVVTLYWTWRCDIKWQLKCSVGCVVWFGMPYVCNGTVRRVIYIRMWWCVHGVMWNGVPTCGGAIWCEVMSVYVKCGAMLNVAISDMVRLTEMQNVWTMACGMRCSGMWKGCHNARCGKSVTMWNVSGGVELWWYAMCCVIVVWRHVKNDVMCCDVRCGGVIRDGIWCGVMRCGIWCGVMRCGIWCGVKYAVMLNVGVVWNSCGYGMAARVRCGLSVWCGTACASVEMWWCEMVVPRRHCRVMWSQL